jgi:molecular chaperone GrpE
VARKVRKSADSEQPEASVVEEDETKEGRSVAQDQGVTAGDADPAAEAAEERAAEAQEAGEMTTVAAADLERLKTEKDEYYDRLLRLRAEFENYKKRVQKEFDSFRKYAAEDVVLEILPVLDSFERALSNVPEGVNDGFHEGVEIIYRQLSEALEKVGLVPMETVGKKFDPNIHDAVTGVESEEHEEGTVVGEFLKGYTLFDKVVRHAKVSVSSGKSGTEDEMRNEP